MGSPRLSVVRLGHTTANTVYSVVASRVTRISHQDISDISGHQDHRHTAGLTVTRQWQHELTIRPD